MKIALVIHTAYPNFVGGKNHYTHSLYSISSRDDEVIVIAGGKDKEVSRRLLNGYTLITLPEITFKVSNNPL
jgi:hypothetical protein